MIVNIVLYLFWAPKYKKSSYLFISIWCLKTSHALAVQYNMVARFNLPIQLFLCFFMGPVIKAQYYQASEQSVLLYFSEIPRIYNHTWVGM